MFKRLRQHPVGWWLSAFWLGLILLLAILNPFLPGPKYDQAFGDYLGSPPFSGSHIFGTTQNGYDVLAGILNGAQLSVFISLISVTIGGSIGVLIGVTAAYFRGRYDQFVNLLLNIMLSIPNLVLSLALLAVLAGDSDTKPASTARKVTVLILSLTIVIIPILGRIARATTLQWSSREFVLASKSMGTKNLEIIRRHILPNIAPAILAIAFFAVGVVIIAEGSLSVLGIGIPGGASWGSMLSNGRGYMEFSPHEVYVPVTVIALTVIACNYFGDYVRTNLDKRESKI